MFRICYHTPHFEKIYGTSNSCVCMWYNITYDGVGGSVVRTLSTVSAVDDVVDCLTGGRDRAPVECKLIIVDPCESDTRGIDICNNKLVTNYSDSWTNIV